MAKDNNLILELQKSSRFWDGDLLMPKNKEYYIERKSYENQSKCEKGKQSKDYAYSAKGFLLHVAV